MAKLSIHIPDGVYAEMLAAMDGERNVSAFVTLAVEKVLGPALCEGGHTVQRGFSYCPECGAPRQ